MFSIYAETCWARVVRNAALPSVNVIEEFTGYATLEQDREAFLIGYEVGREDALDGTPYRICGALPAQRAGYAMGFVGELAADTAYNKWNRLGRAA